MSKMILPPLADWSMYAGGTGAAEGKHAYGIVRDGAQWSIVPVTWPNGRHAGYKLYAYNLKGEVRHGYTWFDRLGRRNYTASGLHRSPQSAAKVAREVHQKIYGGK